MVPTDFSKAFDLVDHTLLIEKIINIGVRGAIVPWICDFLHNRQQCVRYNNINSDYIYIHGGIPQGTKLGPIGFQIFINSAAQDSDTEYWKYVDDLTFAENRMAIHQGCMQDDLDKLKQWSDDNLLKLNPCKCRAIQVFFNKTPMFSDLRIATEPLIYVSEAKVLGLWLQNDLKWNIHVNKMLEKANKTLFMLRTLKRFGFNSKELKIVYNYWLCETCP